MFATGKQYPGKAMSGRNREHPKVEKEHAEAEMGVHGGLQTRKHTEANK